MGVIESHHELHGSTAATQVCTYYTEKNLWSVRTVDDILALTVE
jgi:hypothetical protein